MFVTALELGDFRSYAVVQLSLESGVTVFVGANGQGKTNLIEAVDYLATLGSHRVSSEAPLVRVGAQRAVVRARVQAGREDPRSLLLEIEITPGAPNRARLNKAPLRSPRELLGALRTVLFSPEDLALVKGDPAERRGFLDALIIQRWPRLAGVKTDYDRALRQRTMLLKTLSGRTSGRGAGAVDSTVLAAWDDQVAAFGAELLAARLTTLDDLAPHVAAAYADIAPSNNVATAIYKSALPLDNLREITALREAILTGIAERRGEEIARGQSLVGPHRDDVMLSLGDLPAKGYASHGESWSFALALRLGAFRLLQVDGVEPVLILDDVFAELDTTRRERLAERALEAEQVLVTAAVPEDLPESLAGKRFVVSQGEVCDV